MNIYFTMYRYHRAIIMVIYVLCIIGYIVVPYSVLSKEILSKYQIKQIKKGRLSQHTLNNPGYVRKVRVPKKLPSRSIEYENLIDQIDVYALSIHARKIALPCMISPSFRERLARSNIPIDWVTIIQDASVKHNLDPALIAAVIKVESGFSVKAVSSKGARGLMQVMPKTASELGVIDLFNPSENVHAGSRYLRQQLDRFGCLELALAAYNAGPGAVAKHGGIPPYKETQLFVKKVLSEI